MSNFISTPDNLVSDATLNSEEWVPNNREFRPPVSTRITFEPDKSGASACIRGLHLTVWDVLRWLGSGLTEEEILDEQPDLEKADFPAVYQYALEVGRKAGLAALR